MGTRFRNGACRTRAGLLAIAAILSVAVPPLGCETFFPLEGPGDPNYYTCDCQCSHRVTANVGTLVFFLPAQQPIVDTLPNDSVGTVLGGPVDQDFNGTPTRWWQVQFDGRPQNQPGTGWVTEGSVTVANETSVRKEAQACLPASLNGNVGGTGPTFADLQAFCGGDVSGAAQASVNQKLGQLGPFVCQCEALSAIILSNYNSSCDVGCPNNETVCLAAGSDPPDPIPDPISAALFQPTSLCEVKGATGDVQVTLKGHSPKEQPTVEGVLQVRGRPCPPGMGCRVTMAYHLTSSDIEFDSGTIFASDPKFVDISLSGATEPDAINLGPFLGFYLGEVPKGTALSSGHGRRSGSTTPFGVTGKNTEGLALAMNWANKTCRIGGQLVGEATTGDGNEGDLDAQVDVGLNGTIVNQPPQPNAEATDTTVECTSPAGADVTLDASASTDADGNISFYVWRHGSATGSLVTAPSSNPMTQTHQALGQETYYLQVVDGRFAADDELVTVTVADRTAPQISCNAPDTIVPSDVPEKPRTGLSFTATAEDSCTGVSAVVIQSFACAKPQSCKVAIEGATITIFDSGGVGDTISWIVSAQDAAGNEAQKACELSVIKKK